MRTDDADQPPILIHVADCIYSENIVPYFHRMVMDVTSEKSIGEATSLLAPTLLLWLTLHNYDDDKLGD
jgi:hypothetical protein